jgi:hypothetical protein
VVGTTKTGDAVVQKSLVEKEKGTVMDQEMVVNMMAMVDVKEILCVELTTVESLVLTFMRKTIAVKSQVKVIKDL